MVNNGSVHYDHDRDGTHGQINGCHSKFRARDHDTFVIVSYIDKVLSIYTSVDGDNDWNECFTAADVYLPTGYYFGVSAATGDLADNHDIINIRVFDVDQGENPEWETAVPHADSAEAPREHVDDVRPALGHRSWFLVKVLFGLAVLLVIGGGIGYFVYAKRQEQARKRFY
jgi:mannose-binding lectin 2